MIIIGLIGEQGSGKGTIADYLVKKHSAHKFRFSQVWDDILQRLHIPNERKNQIALATAIRETFGENILAKVLTHDIEVGDHDINVIDGLRMPSELEIFRKVPSFHLIYVTGPIERRFELIKKRKEKSGEENLTFEEFKHTEENAVTEIHIPEIAKSADSTIENTGTLEELYAKVDALLEKLQ